MTVLPEKLLRVMPMKVLMAPQVGDERKFWMVDEEGSVSDTWIRNEDESSGDEWVGGSDGNGLPSVSGWVELVNDAIGKESMMDDE